MQFSKSEYLKAYEYLYFGRALELKTEEMVATGKLPGFHHLALGEEAVLAGVATELGPNDWIQPHFRANPLSAKVLGPRVFAAELVNRVDGTSGGMGGAAHLFSFEKKLGPGVGFLGQMQCLATGIALCYKLDKIDGCVVIGAGDSSMNEGAISEVLNMIAAWKLPVAWYIENNGWGMSTSIHDVTALTDMADRAKGFGLPCTCNDGNDVLLVKEVMREAIQKARKGEPSINEFKITRWRGHFIGDPVVYRDPSEVEEGIKNDPLPKNRKFLLDSKIVTEEELKKIEKEQEAVVIDAFEYALASKEKDPAYVRDLGKVFA